IFGDREPTFSVIRDNAGAVEKMMATLASLAAAHMAATGPKSTAGRQAAPDLARASGTSIGEATRTLEASKQAQSQPEVAAAAKAGHLSRQQLALVAGAVAVNPDAADKLLHVAKTGSLLELADESARARAAHQDINALRQAAHEARSLRHFTDPLGTWHMHAHGTPEDGSKIMAAITSLADKVFATARKEGRRERPEAYGFDGLVGLATSGGAPAAKTDIIVRVDHSALVRGYAIDGETCEIAGFGPVSPQALLDIIDTDDPFLKAVVTKGKDVAGVTHLGRRPNAHQQTALDWLFPTCAAEGCGTRATFLETDHREDWARTHVTVVDLLDRLCKFHHDLKTYQGWRLAEGRGKRPFVPPEHPLHPRHSRTNGASPVAGVELDWAPRPGRARTGSSTTSRGAGP
ncbi:MAG: hypothetical protein ABSE77_11150, partial [Acidimicrobiales bacterium]